MSTSFLHPWLLAALAAVLLPPLIEWLFRRRKRRVELPTIRFLLDNQEQKKVRRQDQFLRMLRMGAILLLVLGVARPLWKQASLDGPQARHVILAIDSTASMSQQLDVSTSFGLAQRKAASVARSLPQGTVVTVVAFSDRVTTPVENETDLHTAAARLESLRPGCGATSIAAPLRWIRDYVQRQKLSAVELYLFSDFQKFTWRREGAESQETARLWNELAGVCEPYFVDVGGPSQFNWLVSHLEPAEYVMSAGMPVTFQASLETRGAAPADARATATFLVDGVKKDVRDVAFSADGGASLVFEHVFPKAGEYLVEVAVDGDRHRIDNRRQYLCRVPENARVLVVDDTADTAQPTSAFLARAIRPPTHPGVDKLSHFDVKIVPPARLSYENLGDYVVVAVAATAQITEPLARQLERFVGDGGAIWFFPGDAANPYDYQRLFFKDGQGLLPCPLGEVTSVAAPAETTATTDPKSPLSLLYGESSHAALAPLARSAGSGELAIRRRMIWKPEQAPGDAAVLVRYSDGVPALVEKPFGRGRTLLANFSVGSEWSYLPALAEFPLLVHGVLHDLVGRPDQGVNLVVGQRFEQPVFVSTQHLLLRGPQGAPVRLTPEKNPQREGDFRVAFSDTSQPGLYEIDASDDVLPRRRFVVNHDASEGDLDRLTAADLVDLYPTASGGWIGADTALDEFTANLHTVTELAPWLLSLLAAVLATETFCAWQFGRRRAESLTTEN